jgi:hypothetical protein
VSKTIVVENWRQYARVGIIQSFDGGITITRVEMVVAHNMDFVRRGILNWVVDRVEPWQEGIRVKVWHY